MEYKRHALYTAVKQAGLATALTAGLAATALAAEPNPYLKDDESWISISGTVQSVERDSFILDFGEGTVEVEMDDGDRDADGYQLLSGDEVTVSGLVDDDFFDTTTIEASSVYVKNLGTTFWSSAMDDESDRFFEFASVTWTDEPHTTIQGTVTAVHDDEFVVNTGTTAIRVEVDDMDLNPLDDDGYLKISSGDYVKVFGEMDDDLFEGHEFEAESVIKLYEG